MGYNLMECEGEEWTHVDQDSDQLRNLVLRKHRIL
jgi:hypothetical protein